MKSHEFIFAIRDRSASRGIAQHILLILASRANDHGYCYPSYRDIARITGYSLRTIARAIKQIPADELQIVCEGGSSKGGERQATKYQILICNRSHRVHGQGDNHSQSDHGHNTDRSHSDYRTVVTESTDRSHSDHPTNHERTNKRTKARLRAPDSSSPTTSLKNGTADPQIPLALQTPAFLKAWEDFDDYRQKGKAKKAWTPHAKEIALRMCSKLGPDAAISAIERSIMSGWTGIFAPNNHEQKAKRSTDEFGFPNL